MTPYLKDEITVILTAWKRNHLQKQISYIQKQTKQPHQIWIYQNESHFDIEISEKQKEDLNISIIQSKDINFKFHGRFALPLLCDTEYVAIFDDDTMPGSRWLENCLDTSKRNNCIVTANGRLMLEGFENKTGQHMLAVADDHPVPNEKEVDFGGHCWFFKSEWCKYIWMVRPFSWDNGEDIHMAAACQIHGGIKCFVPVMPAGDKSLWGDNESQLGRDEHASWRKSDHADLRGKIVAYWVNKGWKPLVLKGKK